MCYKYKKEPGIYIFRNRVNGKRYVGKAQNIRDRLSRHKRGKEKLTFTKALVKYGWNMFDLLIIYIPGATKEELLSAEEFYIAWYRTLTTQNGYNVLQRGFDRTGTKHTPETMVKLRARRCSPETRLKMSQTRKGVPKPTGFGDKMRGTANPGVKVSEMVVKEIRNAYSSGAKVKDLAKRYGLHRVTIGRIIHRYTWKHL